MSIEIPLRFKREDLLTKLRSLIPAAEKADKTAMAAHAKEEKRHFALFQKAVKAALKWDYKKAQEELFSVKVLGLVKGYNGRAYHSELDGPECPVSLLSELQRCIDLVESSAQTRYTIQNSGIYRNIYAALTRGAHEQKGLC